MQNKVAQQAVPGTIGGALSVVWMVYGDWWGFIPPDLGQTQELALTGALAILAAGVVNVVRWLLLPPKKDGEPSDA